MQPHDWRAPLWAADGSLRPCIVRAQPRPLRATGPRHPSSLGNVGEVGPPRRLPDGADVRRCAAAGQGAASMKNEAELRTAMAQYDLRPPVIVWDRVLRRFPGAGKKKSNKSAWIRCFEDGKGAVFGDYSQGLVRSRYGSPARSSRTRRSRTSGKPSSSGRSNARRRWVSRSRRSRRCGATPAR